MTSEFLKSATFLSDTSIGSELFALSSRDFEQTFGQNVSLRVKTPSNTNVVASRHIKREKGLLPVDVHRSKMSLLHVPTAALSSAEAS